MSIRENGALRNLMRKSGRLRHWLPKLLCAYSRNPVHLAALEGINTNLEAMLQSLSNEMRRHVLQTGGIDGMTPLHLIAKRGYVCCLDTVTLRGETLSLLTNKDVWGRQALHIASMSGLEKICFKLLKMGARSDQLDEIGKSSVDYFVESKRKSNTKNTTQADGVLTEHGEASIKPTISKVSYLNKEESKKFLQFAMESPDCRYSHGRTFLHSAVELADSDTIGALLNSQFDLEAQDDDGRTPLHYAVLAGREDMAIALINGFDANVCVGGEVAEKHFGGADLAAIDSQGTTTLMFATREKLENVVKTLLSETEHFVIDKLDGDGETALFYAANLEMVELLVDRKCDTTARNPAGRTRLHMAIDLKQEDIALYLLDPKDLNLIQDRPFDNEGESLLITACCNGLSALVGPILKIWEGLLNKGDSTYDQSPLAWACERGHISVIEELLNFELDVNRAASKWRNMTPLHFSVLGGRGEISDLLLRHKNIDLSRKDTYGRTALECAVRYENLTAVRQLLLHDQMVFSQRVKVLKELFPTSPEGAFERKKALVSDGLKSIKDKELICEFLIWLISDETSPETEQTKTMEKATVDEQEIEPTDRPLSVTDHVERTDGISADANETRAQRSLAVFLTPLATNIIQHGTESIWDPYYLVMLLRDNELRETIKRQQIDDQRFDSDLWSYVDYIERFDRKDVMRPFVNRLKQSEKKYRTPAALAGTEYKESINFNPCNFHGKAGQPFKLDSCNQVHGKLK
jgi:ankyrin repeat protein